MTNTQVTESTEVAKDQQDLIKGDFSPEDAAEIVNHLITKKIRFHEVRSFSNEIRLGETDASSVERVEQLKESRESLNKLIKQAQEQGKNLRVSSTISIELI